MISPRDSQLLSTALRVRGQAPQVPGHGQQDLGNLGKSWSIIGGFPKGAPMVSGKVFRFLLGIDVCFLGETPVMVPQELDGKAENPDLKWMTGIS